MNNKILQIYNKITDMLFPKNYKCIFCNNEIFDENKFCTCMECDKTLPKIEGKTCLKCGSKIKSLSDFCIKCKDNVRFFDQAKAPFQYEEPVSNMIKRLKTNNARYLAEPLAQYLSECFKKTDWQVDCIMYAPMFPDKERKVGFNHAKLLASFLSENINVPIDNNLHKIKNTLKQTEVDCMTRQSNLDNAFRYKGNLKNKNVLLVDDVMTTGATVNTIAYELKSKGARKVFVLTVARTSEDRKKH